MASEAVKKILAAESGAGQRIAEARKRKEEIIDDAQGKSALAIQKKLSEASVESAEIKREYNIRLKKYSENIEAECSQKIEEIRQIANRNMNKAIDAVISRFF